MAVKLCNYYQDEDVNIAKLIYYYGVRYNLILHIQRQTCTDKRIKDLQDIIYIYLELLPVTMPTYLAHRQHVSMKNFEMSSLMKDMSSIKV